MKLIEDEGQQEFVFLIEILTLILSMKLASDFSKK
jgi:hypothetical protein